MKRYRVLFFSVNNPVPLCFLCCNVQSLDMIDDEVRLGLLASKERLSSSLSLCLQSFASTICLRVIATHKHGAEGSFIHVHVIE